MMQRALKFDAVLLGAILLLVGIGIVIIYSSSGPFALSRDLPPSYFMVSHIKKVVAGFVFLALGMTVDHKIWLNMARVLFLLSIFLLIAVLIKGVAAHGATRWISIAGFEFQPSEFVKISVIFLLAAKLSAMRDEVEDFKAGFLRPMILVGVVFALILAQPNYSTASAILFVSVVMLFAAGVPVKNLLLLGLAGLPAMGVLAISSPYRMKRVLALLNPAANENSSYQQMQSLISLGNGGLFGTGLGESTQKLGYLPMPFTDTIYAILGEELGFVGSTIVLLLFGVIIWRGIRIASRSHSRFGMLLALAITTAISFNVFMHVGVCTRLLPPTGQPLPLISFGGTNLVMNLFALGVLLNISNPESGSGIEENMTGGLKV